MKIALPSRNDAVDEHFGHCEYFTIVSVSDDKQILKSEKVIPPQGCGCKTNIISILKDKGVSTMLVGNIGSGAINVINSQGIDVVRGCSGNIDKVVTDYLSGSVKDQNVVCDHHDCH